MGILSVNFLRFGAAGSILAREPTVAFFTTTPG